MSDTGRLIVIEGGEASGKSTQAKRLAEAIGAVLTREPGGTELGEKIRAILLDDDQGSIDPRAELLLMVAARAQHVAEKIRPLLSGGRDVVSDRFNGSTVAYQGYGRGLPLEDVEVACVLASDDIRPDLVILLDVGGQVALARRGQVLDRIESAGDQFHSRVNDGFVALANADPKTWVVVDANGSPDEVFARVIDVVEERIGTRRESQPKR